MNSFKYKQTKSGCYEVYLSNGKYLGIVRKVLGKWQAQTNVRLVGDLHKTRELAACKLPNTKRRRRMPKTVEIMNGNARVDDPPEKKLIDPVYDLAIGMGIEGYYVAINGLRIAGNKPWGGGDVVRVLKVKKSDILAAIKEKNGNDQRRRLCASRETSPD